MPDITSPIPALPGSTSKPSFLTIPLELRLQIYSYVLLAHPVHHAHLAPLEPPKAFSGMNTEEFHTTRLAPPSNSERERETEVRTSITRLAPSSSSTQEINALYPISAPTTLASPRQTRVQGKIPTALLVSCKQVCGECKMVPWERNTFTFINWFWSGVYAARQFTRSLRPWQRDGMRYVGVEVLGRDLKVDGTAEIGAPVGVVERGEWWELCSLWRGVQGLRLGIKGAVAGEKGRMVDGSGGGNGEHGQAGDEGEGKESGVLDVKTEWVTEGLLQMRQLRWVEIEVEDEDVEREAKIRFCGELEAAFNTELQQDMDGEERTKVKVIFIERRRVAEDPVSNKDFTWYGGTPGNDSLFGLDM
jgi:hypothetical protein